MDLAHPERHFPASRSVAGGLFASLGLLTLALLGGVAAGVLSTLLLRAVSPGLPAYLGLIPGVASLVFILALIARRYRWMMPWYYVLPAIVFLLTFTFFPVALTVWLAFTDYAGARNGQLNVATTTRVVAAAGVGIELANAAELRCGDLRNGCNNVRVHLYSGSFERVEVVSLAGAVLTLAEPIPSGRSVRRIAMFLPALGFEYSTEVDAIEGLALTLQRPPPFEPDLARVRVQLLDVLPRRILTLEGNTATLDEAIPVDFAVTEVARFNEYGFIGWRNFANIISRAPRSLLPVFVWNVSFAVLTILINTAFGVLLAVLLNNPDLRFRNVYRTLLILPWALPSIITIQVWRGFLNENFGAINRLLMLLNITPEPINWLGVATSAQAAVLLVNLWLGLPFMMTAVLGALSAIPRELYEAARIDGATPWQAFWGVTAPLLRTALVPITLTGFAFNFNNFNLIFLLTDGGPPVDGGTATARGTDILITWAYNEAFRTQGGFAYGLGSAISILIFVITLAVSLINFRVTGALKEEVRT